MTAELRLIAPNTERDREGVYDLMAKSFPGKDYWQWWDICAHGYIGESFYDWSASRVGYIGDEMVTHFGVWDYAMRIGGATVRTGGIGAVSTHGQYRKRGLSSRTAEAGIEAMREAGYDMTILFGIRNFYHRFGYVLAWPETTYTVQASDLPSDGPTTRKFSYRPGREEDRLYNRRATGLTGTAVRPTYRRDRQLKTWQCRRWMTPAGKTAGYIMTMTRGQQLMVGDFAGDSAEVLGALGRLARRTNCNTVSFPSLHESSELAKKLRAGDCRIEQQYTRSGRAMIRTVNLRSSLAKISGELGKRLAASTMADWAGELLIEDSRQRVTLRIGDGVITAVDPLKGRVKHAIRGGDEIAQLLIGTHPPDEVLGSRGGRTTGDGAALARALFPAQQPMLSAWDHY